MTGEREHRETSAFAPPSPIQALRPLRNTKLPLITPSQTGGTSHIATWNLFCSSRAPGVRHASSPLDAIESPNPPITPASVFDNQSRDNVSRRPVFNVSSKRHEAASAHVIRR